MKKLTDWLWVVRQNPTMLRELYLKEVHRLYREYHEHKARQRELELNPRSL